MQGKRVDEVGETGQYPFPTLKPGEYGKGSNGIWYCLPPDCADGFDGLYGNLGSHKVEEHEDGTITVSPSILIGDGYKSWHGFLEKGIWRMC
jgi:hypothetical protein